MEQWELRTLTEAFAQSVLNTSNGIPPIASARLGSPGGRFEVELEGTGIMFAWKKVSAKVVVSVLSSHMVLLDSEGGRA